MKVQLQADLKLSAQQYAFMKMHLNAMRSAQSAEDLREHAAAIEVRAQFIADMVLAMKSKLLSFKKKAQLKCL
jgi:hypothetical protein